MVHSFNPDSNSLLEGIPGPAMVLDRKFRIVAMNRLMEAITGYSLDEAQGVLGELVIRSNVRNSRGQHYNKVLQDCKAMVLDGDILDTNRTKRRVQYHIAPLQSITDKEQGLLVIIAEEPSNQINERIGIGDFADDLIGHGPKMQKVHDMAQHMALTDASILITGETGTGKDMIAESIHKGSSRTKFPFIKINCGALPEGLLESELFGHVKGAFTGASRNKAGMFKLADKGTLFLTEIGDMPLPLQVKLLSVLDDRRFMPVGGEHSIDVDVRIIAATHRSLRDQVRRGEFREDLFYRLNVLHLHLPPLREREDDVNTLLEHFREKTSNKLTKSILGFDQEAKDILLTYPYPGNIREMANIIEYSIHMCRGKQITKEQLPPYIFNHPDGNALVTNDPEPTHHAEKSDDQLAFPVTVTTREPANERWEDIEKEMIIDALKEYSGNRSLVMERFGWNRMKLWRKMKKYGLL